MASGSPPESNGQPVGGNDHVELADMADKKPSLPIEEDIMQLARLGEIAAIQKLFDGGKFDATYRDEQGITPLHVRPSLAALLYGTGHGLTTRSGLPSTTTSPCATSSSRRAQT
jgi:hypothetical protein